MSENQTEPRLSAYLHGVGGRLGLPISGTFELTSRCNFDCPMCYVHRSQNDTKAAARELTAEQWIAIARKARDRGMVFVLLTGGEPFVRKDFFEIYSAMKAMGLMISINSNGSMLEGEILRRLIENPPLRINVSLYGGSGETYRTMCGQDAFDRVTGNIAALKKAGIDVRLNLSITPYNQHDMERIYNIARELQVPVKASSYMYPSIRLEDEYGTGNRLSPEEAARCRLYWDELRLEPEEVTMRGRQLLRLVRPEDWDCGVEDEPGVKCRAGHSTFWATWEGKMLPCGMMTEPVVDMCQLGFTEAWEQIRAATARIRRPAECMECPKRDICSACAAACYAETGSFEGKPEFMCEMTDALLRLHQQRSERINEDHKGTD